MEGPALLVNSIFMEQGPRQLHRSQTVRLDAAGSATVTLCWPALVATECLLVCVEVFAHEQGRGMPISETSSSCGKPFEKLVWRIGRLLNNGYMAWRAAMGKGEICKIMTPTCMQWRA